MKSAKLGLDLSTPSSLSCLRFEIQQCIANLQQTRAAPMIVLCSVQILFI